MPQPTALVQLVVMAATAAVNGCHGNIITRPRRMWARVSEAAKRRHAKVKLAVMQCCRSVKWPEFLSTSWCPVNRRCLSVTPAFSAPALQAAHRRITGCRGRHTCIVDWFIFTRYRVNTRLTWRPSFSARLLPCTPSVIEVAKARVECRPNELLLC